MVEESGAKSTDMQHPEDVEELSKKCKDAAEHWAPVAAELWQNSEGRERSEEKVKEDLEKKAKIAEKAKSKMKVRVG